MSLNLPNPCLLGIVLTISTHSGPQVVFHYPPTDRSPGSRHVKRQQKADDHGFENKGSSYSLRSQGKGSTPKKRSQKFQHDGESEANLSIHSNKTENVYSDMSSSSSDEDPSTGLSDGDISTDYADVSSSSSSSASDSESEDFNATRSYLENSASLKSQDISMSGSFKGTQVSATKVFQLLRPDESKRNSVVSRHTSTRDPEVSWSNAVRSISDSEYGEEPLCELNDQHFGSDFQDINKILRFDKDFFAEISSPPKEMCNTRFELTIDELALVGLPIHRNADGQWRKTKKRKSSSRSKRSNSSSRTRKVSRSHSEGTDVTGDSGILEEQLSGSQLFEEETGKAEYEALEKSVNMFHLCFLTNPRLVEYNKRVDDIYHYVVSRLSLVLRYAQIKSGYVTRECYEIIKTQDRILKSSERYKSIKGPANKARYLYQKIIQRSSLARAISKCFDAISQNEVANLEIDGDKIISLQIPIINEFDVLPDLKTDPVLKGSFLTSILNRKFLEEGSATMNEAWARSHDENDDLLDYAVLLLNEPAIIIQESQFSSPQNDITSVLLTSLVKHLKPTVPLRNYQYVIDEIVGKPVASESDVEERNSFQTSMLRSLALHLMYWRHARVIIPVSSKNTYIVSPLAPITGNTKDDFSGNRLDSEESKPLILQNQEVFSKKFPSLPPLPVFLSLVSSMKPRAFGSIIPSKDHKSVYLSALAWLIRYGYLTQLLTFAWVRVDSRIKIAVDEDLEIDGVRRSKRAQEQSLNSDISDNIVSRDQIRTDSAEDDLDFFYYGGDEDIINNSDFTIILSPETATAVEKRWLYKCIEGQPVDIQVLFHRVVKYMNGKIPIELVQLREGISRHEIKRLFHALGKYLVDVYHW
ncbi:Nitrogen permease regulator 3 [Lachancea thermotolerans]